MEKEGALKLHTSLLISIINKFFFVSIAMSNSTGVAAAEPEKEKKDRCTLKTTDSFTARGVSWN